MKINLKFFLITFLASSLLLASVISIGAFSSIHNKFVKEESNIDVVVVGAGPSGIAAAIKLARSNYKVILIEQTDWLGGQMTAAGVSTIDDGYIIENDPGIFGEFISLLKEEYKDKPINVCYWQQKSRCFEPHVGRVIFEKMIADEPNIKILYRTTVSAIGKDDKNIKNIKTTSSILKNNDITINAKILIDASETGYSLPLVDSEYRAGNVTSSSTLESSCIQSITYTMVVRKYFNGVPKKLQFSKGFPPGGIDSYTYAKNYLFRPSLEEFGNSWFVEGKTKVPYSWDFFAGFRGIPDSNKLASNYTASDIDKNDLDPTSQYTKQISKTILNMTNDFPATVEYLGNQNIRKQIDCKAKLRSLQNLYYIQIELGQKDWSIANDEGYDTAYNIEENSCTELKNFSEFEKHLPVMPYIRESYRLIGDYTLTGKDIHPVKEGDIFLSQSRFDSSLAVGDYGNDLHGCNQSEDLELDFEQLEDKTDIRRIFQVPFESFVTSRIGGLIVAEKNLSATRLASAALRTQPTAMQIGLAAGSIAVVSLNTNRLPADVDYKLVQEEILKLNGSTNIIK